MTLTVSSALGALAAFQTQPLTTQDANQANSAQIIAPIADANASSSTTLTDTTSTGATTSAAADSLGQATSIADTAQSAAGSVVQLLRQLQQAASAASNPNLDSASRASLDATFQTLTANLTQAVGGASAGGVNLVDGSATPSVQVAADADGGRASLSAYNLSLGGPVVTLPSDASLTTATSAANALSEISSSLQSTSSALANLSNQAKQIGAHADFVATLGASLSAGSSTAPDDADGVRLQALQLQQLLSGQTSGIANAGPQAVLSLFKAS